MKTIKPLFKHFPKSTSARYLEPAFNIYKQLLQGQDYRTLGGCRLTVDRELIRFRLGPYRLIFKNKHGLIIPIILIARKNFDAYLKRR